MLDAETEMMKSYRYCEKCGCELEIEEKPKYVFDRLSGERTEYKVTTKACPRFKQNPLKNYDDDFFEFEEIISIE